MLLSFASSRATRPCTNARYVFSTCRRENCSAKCLWAVSVRATSNTPLVSLSMRWHDSRALFGYCRAQSFELV